MLRDMKVSISTVTGTPVLYNATAVVNTSLRLYREKSAKFHDVHCNDIIHKYIRWNLEPNTCT